MPSVPTTVDLSRIYDIAKVGATPSLAGIGQRETFDLGTVGAASVKDPVTVLSGFTPAPRWTPPSMPKFASGLEPTKFDFITVSPAAPIAASEEGIEAEDFSEVAGSTWNFAERLGTWAQDLPDRETRSILLNLGGVLVSLAGTVVSLKAGGGAPFALAVASLIYSIDALINSIIDKIAA